MDDLIVGAGKELLGIYVIGPVFVLTLFALGWVVKQWMASINAHLAEKQARLDDAKQFASTQVEMKLALMANTGALSGLSGNVQQLVDASLRKGR